MFLSSILPSEQNLALHRPFLGIHGCSKLHGLITQVYDTFKLFPQNNTLGEITHLYKAFHISFLSIVLDIWELKDLEQNKLSTIGTGKQLLVICYTAQFFEVSLMKVNFCSLRAVI